jgi:hypothetical protein
MAWVRIPVKAASLQKTGNTAPLTPAATVSGMQRRLFILGS